MRLTKLHQVAANMNDSKTTRAFYEELLEARYVAEYESPALLFFDFCGTRVLFEHNQAPATLYFWVDNINEAYEEFKMRGLVFNTEPQLIHRDDAGQFGKPGMEEWMTFAKDPGGNTIALVTRR